MEDSKQIKIIRPFYSYDMVDAKEYIKNPSYYKPKIEESEIENWYENMT